MRRNKKNVCPKIVISNLHKFKRLILETDNNPPYISTLYQSLSGIVEMSIVRLLFILYLHNILLHSQEKDSYQRLLWSQLY